MNVGGFSQSTATEFIFVNDRLSNGIWDREDPEAERAAADDDARELPVSDVPAPEVAMTQFRITRMCVTADSRLP